MQPLLPLGVQPLRRPPVVDQQPHRRAVRQRVLPRLRLDVQVQALVQQVLHRGGGEFGPAVVHPALAQLQQRQHRSQRALGDRLAALRLRPREQLGGLGARGEPQVFVFHNHEP